MRVELVGREQFVAAAAPLLRSAWEPPAIHYSAEYVRWQLDFPGHAEPVAALAYDGDLTVGCIAAVPRRLRLGQTADEAYLVSFVAVAASHRRQGIAARLYDRLLDSLRALQRPVVTFAAAGSGGQRSLLRSYGAAGFTVRALGELPVYAYAPARGPASPGPTIEVCEEAGFEGTLARRSTDRGVLWSYPDPAAVEHYRRHPFGREIVGIRNGTDYLGAAIVGRSEVSLPAQIASVGVIDCIWLEGTENGALSALAEYVQGGWSRADAAQPVMLPNPCRLLPDALRAARFRQTGSRFAPYLCSPTRGHPFEEADATNLEVV